MKVLLTLHIFFFKIKHFKTLQDIILTVCKHAGCSLFDVDSYGGHVISFRNNEIYSF